MTGCDSKPASRLQTAIACAKGYSENNSLPAQQASNSSFDDPLSGITSETTELNVYPNEFHGEWNYKILPN